MYGSSSPVNITLSVTVHLTSLHDSFLNFYYKMLIKDGVLHVCYLWGRNHRENYSETRRTLFGLMVCDLTLSQLIHVK